MRLAACVAAISLFVLSILLLVLHSVGDFYHPNEPDHSFWLLWIPLVVTAPIYFLSVSLES
jgi:hypothetical protein